MTAFFDVVYQDRKCSAPTDIEREFLSIDVESLDAPNVIPAGATRANSSFHHTAIVYRQGA